MMTDQDHPIHYICTGGCKGVSQTPGVCQTDGCPKHEHPLEECDCVDSKHYGKLETLGSSTETLTH